jgi:hypothetical protein
VTGQIVVVRLVVRLVLARAGHIHVAGWRLARVALSRLFFARLVFARVGRKNFTRSRHLEALGRRRVSASAALVSVVIEPPLCAPDSAVTRASFLAVARFVVLVVFARFVA